MANETSTTRSRKSAAQQTAVTQEQEVTNEAAVEAVEETAEKERFVPKDVSQTQIITVRNGFQGRLVYKSKKTGERFVWDSFGSEQDMEIGELRNARNSNKKYFINNWFMFDEPWVVDYLGMKQYYKFALTIEDFDTLFEKPVSEMVETISKLSDGQKKSVAYRAKLKIADGTIDSNKTISALEKCLGTELVER
jgi:hypothetical protein